MGLLKWFSGKESLLMLEIQVQSLRQEDPLEKEMATHSSIFAWEISLTEQPGRLYSMRSQKARHNWETEHACTHTLNIYDFYLTVISQ